MAINPQGDQGTVSPKAAEAREAFLKSLGPDREKYEQLQKQKSSMDPLQWWLHNW